MPVTEREQIERSIAALEDQRVALGDAVVAPALARGQSRELEDIVTEILTAQPLGTM